MDDLSVELYYIQHLDKPGCMISGVGIGSCRTTHSVMWAKSKSYALHFEKEEAEATIAFIRDVVDWELADGLYIHLAE